MKLFVQRLLILALLAAFFVPAVFIGTWALVLSVFGPTGFLQNVLYALDRFIASTLGFSGRYTVSAECAVGHSVFCKILRTTLNTIYSNHCEIAAESEGLTNGS